MKKKKKRLKQHKLPFSAREYIYDKDSDILHPGYGTAIKIEFVLVFLLPLILDWGPLHIGHCTEANFKICFEDNALNSKRLGDYNLSLPTMFDLALNTNITLQSRFTVLSLGGSSEYFQYGGGAFTSLIAKISPRPPPFPFVKSVLRHIFGQSQQCFALFWYKSWNYKIPLAETTLQCADHVGGLP